MAVTRTLKQIKVFDIIAQGQWISGHGYGYAIDGIVYSKEQIFESDENCTELLNQAIENWEERRNKNPWGTTDHKPKLITYWKTVEEIE